MRNLVVGCGYLGHRVATRWRDAGHQVTAMTRSPARADTLAREGLEPLVGDVTRPDQWPPLPHFDTVLYAVGYDRAAGLPMRTVYVDGLEHVITRLAVSTGRLIYISSTGVYGQDDGAWIDETSNSQPTREGGRVCLAAEQRLAASPFGPRTMVLRLGGIYGPGRVPRRADLLAGQPIAAEPDGFLNLIHVDDAATVVLAAAERGVPPARYVVVDDEPVRRRDYFRLLAELCQAPPPQFRAPSPTARSGGSKRVSNARLHRELGVSLAFPTYREGLTAIIAVEA